ncbi:MAG TPA: hypothetical protein VJR24_17560, partial [Gemmatimonadaceae bacterium]|nr:hypothetical protein [Gemmatimonadaceae bacterium]
YRAVACTDWTWDWIIAKNVPLPGEVTPAAKVSVAVNEAGTRSTTGTHIPVGVCACLGLQSATASRRFRGHLLLPPAWTASAVGGDGLNQSDAYWTNCGAFLTELLKGADGGSGWTGAQLSAYRLCIYSRKAASLSLPYVVHVSGGVIRPKASFLRRRERGSI